MKNDLWEFDQSGGCADCIVTENDYCQMNARKLTGIYCGGGNFGCFKKPEKWEPCTDSNVYRNDTLKHKSSNRKFKAISSYDDLVWVFSEEGRPTVGFRHSIEKINNFERLIK